MWTAVRIAADAAGSSDGKASFKTALDAFKAPPTRSIRAGLRIDPRLRSSCCSGLNNTVFVRAPSRTAGRVLFAWNAGACGRATHGLIQSTVRGSLPVAPRSERDLAFPGIGLIVECSYFVTLSIFPHFYAPGWSGLPGSIFHGLP